MKRETGPSPALGWDSKRKITIRTTMVDLIRALNDELKTGEEVLVPFIVLDMMDRGLLKFVDSPKTKGALSKSDIKAFRVQLSFLP